MIADHIRTCTLLADGALFSNEGVLCFKALVEKGGPPCQNLGIENFMAELCPVGGDMQESHPYLKNANNKKLRNETLMLGILLLLSN